MSTTFSVCIAVCTYRRAEALANLLTSLGCDSLTHPSVRDVRLLIVDNDAAGSAKSVFQGALPLAGLLIDYVVEARRGLAAARNRALHEASGADLLIFLDDDEFVRPGWFRALLEARAVSGAAFVIGPVRPTFPPDAAQVFRRSGLFERFEPADLKRLETGNTGNALIDLSLVRRYAISFREDFNRSGGEDDAFFREIRARGGIGVFAAHALVEEPVAPERLSFGWILRRRIRFGTTQVLQERIAGQLSVFRRIGYFVHGGARLVAGGSLGLLVWPMWPHKALRYWAAAARGLGYSLGSLGLNVLEY